MKTPRAIAKITPADIAAAKIIAACGFVRIEKGEPCLESHTQLGLWRWQRLIHHGLVQPQEDGLIEDMPQTWILSPRGNALAQGT
jgi:hypothetical protein